MGKGVLNLAGKSINKIPGMGKNLDKLNKAGVLDAADDVVGMIGQNPSGVSKGSSLASPMKANRMNPGKNLQGLSKHETPKPTANTSSKTSDNTAKGEESTTNNKKTKASASGSLANNKVIGFFKAHPQLIGPALIGCGILLIFFLILLFIFSDTDADASLGGNSTSSSSSFSTSVSANAQTTDACTQINQPIGDFLESQGSSLEEFNNYIVSEVRNAGLGTRNGVVAAALALVGGLCQNYNARLPYTMGGAHPPNFYGAKDLWGTPINGGSGAMRYGYGPYFFEGPDCSGFVNWAIYNGGYSVSDMVAANFGSYGTVHSMSSFTGQPGDILFNDHHVVLIVGTQSDNYLIAEASSGENGTRITTTSKTSNNYQVVDMTQFYENEANKNIANYPAATSPSNTSSTTSSSSTTTPTSSTSSAY